MLARPDPNISIQDLFKQRSELVRRDVLTPLKRVHPMDDHQIPVGDDDRLYAGIARLIEDKGLRARLAEKAARTIAEGFSEDHMIDRLEAYFRQAISGR